MGVSARRRGGRMGGGKGGGDWELESSEGERAPP